MNFNKLMMLLSVACSSGLLMSMDVKNPEFTQIELYDDLRVRGYCSNMRHFINDLEEFPTERPIFDAIFLSDRDLESLHRRFSPDCLDEQFLELKFKLQDRPLFVTITRLTKVDKYTMRDKPGFMVDFKQFEKIESSTHSTQVLEKETMEFLEKKWQKFFDEQNQQKK